MSDENFLTAMLALENSDQDRTEFVRAPFAYPGSKHRSLDQLLPCLPYRNTYIEPFGGSGAVLIARDASPLEVFNDRHSGITCFYRCVASPKLCNELIDRFAHVIHSREEFIWSRDTWNDECLDIVERAARWYYSVAFSFTSKGWSFGRTTSGRAQAGAKIWNNIRFLPELSKRFRNVQFENLDYRMCFKDYDKESVVWYLDPPYWLIGNAFEHAMSKTAEHIELCERIKHLHGFVALSGYDVPDHPYNKFDFWTHKISWKVRSSVAGMAFTETNHLKGFETKMEGGRTLVKETLWIRE